MRVLVASDDALILEQFADLPQLVHHDMAISTDPAEIARLAADADVVVLDLDGHEQAGMDLLERLAQDGCRARIVLLSSRNPRELNFAYVVGTERNLQMGVPQCKPLDKARILDSVLGLLSPQTLDVQPEDVRRALDDDQLVIFYHPLKTISSDSVHGCEALVRWNHPEYGLLNPDYIIPVAEEHGLITDVTRFMLRNALRQCRIWKDAGWDFQVAVNVSAQGLREPTFVNEVDRAIRHAGVSPENLALEITESQTLSQQTEIINALTRLMFLGVNLAIDDFGTGYSSMSRLVSMPFHEVKIDKSFVMKASVRLADHELNTAKQIMRDQAETVVHAITNLGHNLDLKVIAEGVATREAWNLVSRLGCDVAQGFFISVPIAADEFGEWLKREAAARALADDADGSGPADGHGPNDSGPEGPGGGGPSADDGPRGADPSPLDEDQDQGEDQDDEGEPAGALPGAGEKVVVDGLRRKQPPAA